MKDRHGTSTVVSQRPNQSTDDEGPPRKRRTLLTPEDPIQSNAGARSLQTSCRHHARDLDMIVLIKVFLQLERL